MKNFAPQPITSMVISIERLANYHIGLVSTTISFPAVHVLHF